jgi:hypothetical protein
MSPELIFGGWGWRGQVLQCGSVIGDAPSREYNYVNFYIWTSKKQRNKIGGGGGRGGGSWAMCGCGNVSRVNGQVGII